MGQSGTKVFLSHERGDFVSENTHIFVAPTKCHELASTDISWRTTAVMSEYAALNRDTSEVLPCVNLVTDSILALDNVVVISSITLVISAHCGQKCGRYCEECLFMPAMLTSID